MYANWKADSYTVTFDSNEGSTITDQVVSYNSTALVPSDPSKPGFTFGGWYADEDLTIAFAFTTAIIADITLYANWATDSYSVTFHSNGGTPVSSQAVSYNGTAAEPSNPTKSGYTFDGWYKDAGLTTAFSFVSAITGNTTLYAKWTASSNADLGNLIVSDTILSPSFAPI